MTKIDTQRCVILSHVRSPPSLFRFILHAVAGFPDDCVVSKRRPLSNRFGIEREPRGGNKTRRTIILEMGLHLGKRVTWNTRFRRCDTVVLSPLSETQTRQSFVARKCQGPAEAPLSPLSLWPIGTHIDYWPWNRTRTTGVICHR